MGYNLFYDLKDVNRTLDSMVNPQIKVLQGIGLHSNFWLRQEPKESRCSCVRACVRVCDIMLYSTLQEFLRVLKGLTKGPKWTKRGP